MKTTAAGNVVTDSAVCVFCGKRVGFNANGYMAKHGHNKWTRQDCRSRAVAYYVQILEPALVALASFATRAS